MRSTTCTGNNGKYLEEYHSESSALLAAEEIQEQYGNTLSPIHCRRCNYWHLVDHSIRKQCMFCTDRGLFLKDIYATKEEAQRTADWIRRSKKIQLSPYKCPYSHGWHLTKR